MTWFNALFIQILNMSITAGICTAVILSAHLVFRNAPRKYLYALWLVAAFRLICPVSLESGFSLFNLGDFSVGVADRAVGYMEYISSLPETDAKGAAAAETSGTADAAEQETPGAVSKVPEASVETAREALSEEARVQNTGSAGILPPQAVTAGSRIWFLGMFVFLAYFLWNWQRTGRQVRMAVRAADGVYECDQISSPFVFGVLRPRIYIPCGMSGEQREMVVLHEQCHLKRKDHLVKLLSFVLLGIYWFHPLVWAGWLCMCRDMEMSCDERVLEQMGEERRTDYSRTLLALGTEPGSAGRLPTAFGENDVKKRVRHALAFRKPTFWMALGAAALFLAALILLGTNGIRPENGREADTASAYSANAEALYENRNPYVGDASANGRLIGAIGEALPDSPVNYLPFHTELQTSEEPYGFYFVLERAPEERDIAYMAGTSVLMLALTDNLGEVEWKLYSASDKEESTVWHMTAAEAGAYCGVDDVKSYGASPESVQELLDVLEQSEITEGAVSDAMSVDETGISGGAEELSSEEFLQWYGELPSQLYEEAVPLEQDPHDADRDYMVILAQTEDETVTVYGFSGKEYGTRGVTINWNPSPNGSVPYTYHDWWWTNSGHYEVVESDYDGDGREEIALVIMGARGNGVNVERLMILENEDGYLGISEFDPLRQQEEWQRYIDWSVDRENKLVQIIRRNSEVSVPVLSLSYEDWTEEGGEPSGIVLGDQVYFSIDEEIQVYYEVGIRMENAAAAVPVYQEDRSDWLVFSVTYHDPPDGQNEVFELSGPREGDRNEVLGY